MSARTAVAVVLGFAVMLVISPAASAGAPVISSETSSDDVFLFDCGDFDLYDIVQFEENKKEFLDDEGNTTRIVSHVAGSDTFYNSENPENRVTGTINSGEIVDFVNGTVTQSGATGRITVQGEGAFFFDVGKYVIEFGKGLVFIAGHHHAFFEEDYEGLCELLA